MFSGLRSFPCQGIGGPVAWVADFENCVFKDNLGNLSTAWVSILRRLGTLGRRAGWRGGMMD